jgi:hypothetical protein
MAEILDINQMLANEYEPKRMFRWILELDGIDAFTAKTAARPTKQFEKTTIDYINQKTHYAGKGEWQTFDIVLNDPIAPAASQKVMEWLRLIHDDATGRMGYAALYKKTFSIKILDPAGMVVEKWRIVGAWPSNVTFGELDYASNDVLTAKFTVQPDRCFQEF